MSDFCFEDEACQAREMIGDGPREVVKVWRMVNWGRRVAIKIEPFWYPMAYVRQSVAGARAVIGSKIVRAEMCSEVGGSKRITSPLPLPV
jgi:hypothetical protein